MTNKIIFSLLSLFFITGCASMSEDECKTGNWAAYGERDAMQGYASSRLAKHQEACADYKVNIDKKLYMKGFNKGLENFCQKDSAFNYGLKGGTYNYTCPSELSKTFMKHYNKGKKIYKVKKKVSRLDSEIDSISNKISSGETTDAQRTEYLYKLREKEKEKSDLEKQLIVLEMKKD